LYEKVHELVRIKLNESKCTVKQRKRKSTWYNWRVCKWYICTSLYLRWQFCWCLSSFNQHCNRS